MLTALTIVIIGLAALYVVLAPMSEPDLLLPGPSFWQQYRERKAQHTLEEANTLDWIERVKDTPEHHPEPRRRRRVETVQGRPPWEPVPAPPAPAPSMTTQVWEFGPPPANIDAAKQNVPNPWPPGHTGAHALIKAAYERPLYGPPDVPDWPSAPEPDPGPEPELAPDPERDPGPEAEQDWPPELPRDAAPEPADSTVVRGIKAFTHADLEDYIRKMDAYKGRS